MYMCMINNWFAWNMENMCNCKEITLITHEISTGQNSITRPAKPLTRGKCKIPVTVKWTISFIYDLKNSFTKYDKLHPGSTIIQCTMEKENYPPCRLIFLSFFPFQKKKRKKERKETFWKGNSIVLIAGVMWFVNKFPKSTKAISLFILLPIRRFYKSLNSEWPRICEYNITADVSK